MASKRCLPTRFFKDPDIMNVGKDTQLILVGLVLLADDEGRELADNDLLLLYQVGRHRYYSLTRWSQWQTISSQKMTPSRYPAPLIEAETPATTTTAATTGDETPPGGNEPDELPPSENGSQDSPEIPRISPGKDGESWESQTQYNLSKGNSSESKRIEDEGEAQPPHNVVPFPAARADAVCEPVLAEKKVLEATKQVAAILKVPASDGLQRVVADYLGEPGVSLLGEADAAREWIEDPRRNRKGQILSPAFFRRWLKREHDTVLRGFAPPGSAAAETPNGMRPPLSQARAFVNGKGPPGALSQPAQEDNPYRVFVRERAQAVLRRASVKPEEMAPSVTPSPESG